jgi:hypothetical protein
MQYTIQGFQQSVIVKMGLDNDDVTLLRWIIDFYQTNKMAHKVIDYKIFVWIKYDYVIKELPALYLEFDKDGKPVSTGKQILGRRFAVWEQKGLISKKLTKGEDVYISNGREYIRYGTYTYFNINQEVLLELLSGAKSELANPKTGGVVVPSSPPAEGPENDQNNDEDYSQNPTGVDTASSTAGSDAITKDSSTYPSIKNSFINGASAAPIKDSKIIFKFQDWQLREDGWAYCTTTLQYHKIKDLPRLKVKFPIPVQMLIDEKIGYS